jgi:hypothetical protein
LLYNSRMKLTSQQKLQSQFLTVLVTGVMLVSIIWTIVRPEDDAPQYADYCPSGCFLDYLSDSVSYHMTWDFILLIASIGAVTSIFCCIRSTGFADRKKILLKLLIGVFTAMIAMILSFIGVLYFTL